MDRINECISCGSKDFIFYANNTTLNLPIYICKKCRLYVTGLSKLEIEKKVLELYKRDFWDEVREKELSYDFLDNYSRGRIRLWKSQFKYVSKMIFKNHKILEIGCGHGVGILEFHRLGFDIVGIEPDEINVNHINRKIGKQIVSHGMIENIELYEKFDCIWMSHVFEHLVDPIDFLKKIKHNMTSTGFIFIEVPNVEKRNDYRKFTSVPHAYNFSKISLTNILNKVGFNVLECDCIRPPKKIEGALNRIYKKIFKTNFYPYYPRIITNELNGEDIRLIAKL